MADDQRALEIQILTKYLGAEEAKKAVGDLDKLRDSQDGVGKATAEATEKFGESRREIRFLGDEIGRMAGVSHLGGLALGGVAAAAFATVTALEFLKATYVGIKQAITGPISVGLPDDAATKISAAAVALEAYAKARQKVIDASKSPEAMAADEENKLGKMSPEAKKSAEDNLKRQEALALDIEAHRKKEAALAIKVTPEDQRETNQETLDESASKAQTAKDQIKGQLEIIARQRASAGGNTPAEYGGSYGKIQQADEAGVMYLNYAGMTFDEAEKQEKVRLAQAQQQIDAAKSYKKREEAAAKEQQRLMDEAGTASGKAQVIRDSLGADPNAPRFSNQAPPKTFEQTPSGTARRDFDQMEAAYDLLRGGGSLSKDQENMLQEILKAATGHKVAHEKMLDALKKINQDNASRDAAFDSLAAKVQRNTNAVDLH